MISLSYRPYLSTKRVASLCAKALKVGEKDCVASYREEYSSKPGSNAILAKWKDELKALKLGGGRVVLWGGGSKAVAFLTTLNLRDEIKYAVDINPNKHGTYIAGTGQEIVASAFLVEYKPDVVIVMNPIYCDEIQQDLNEMGLDPELMPLA